MNRRKNSKLYNDRIEERLSWKVCMFYESPDDGGVPVSRQFKCTHFFHPKCVTTWKFFGLDKTKRKEKKFISNECFGCKSGRCYIYKDLYDHDCNSDGTVTKSRVNARYVTGDVSHSVARFQVRRPTALNIRNYHLYENEYNSSKYNNEFDIIHYLIFFVEYALIR